MENAQQLIAHGDTVAEGCIGVNTMAGDAVNTVVQRLQQVKDQIEETTSVAANLLGDGHSAVQTVTGSAAVVSEKIDELMGQARALQERITSLDQLLSAHGFYHGIGATGAAYSEKLGEAMAAAEEWASAIHDAADKLMEDSGG
jgi:conjugal transfer/entry exclusion protein